MDWRHDGRETTGLEEYERSTRQKSEVEHPDVQAVNTEYPSQMYSVLFLSKNHPWDKSQVEIVLSRKLLGD